MFEPDAITLRIYCTPIVFWEGSLSVGVEEVGRVPGCDSPQALEQAVGETGVYPDHIEIEAASPMRLVRPADRCPS